MRSTPLMDLPDLDGTAVITITPSVRPRTKEKSMTSAGMHHAATSGPVIA